MDYGSQLLRTSLPLASRLDRLDFIMKYLERKHKAYSTGATGGRGMENQCMPLTEQPHSTATHESLHDRVASLEHRLIQICLEMETSRPLSSTNKGVQFRGSSRHDNFHGYTSELPCSYPVFSKPNINNHVSKEHPQTQPRSSFEIQPIQEICGTSEPKKQKQSSPLPPKRQHHANNIKERNGKKTFAKGKKATPRHWPTLRMFGCS